MTYAKHEFGPVYDAQSQILILGSFPSVKSREAGFYYMHPQNRFWPLLAALYKEAVPNDIPLKKALLLRHRIALWDVLESCEITGSSDSSIQKPIPNDLWSFVQKTRIQKIYTNGKKADKLYQKFTKERPLLPSYCLPSTSPANAQYSFQKLLENWKVIL